MAPAFQKGIFQCARNRRGQGPLLLTEGEAYVFHVEAAADDGPRIEERLELRTTVGGTFSTDRMVPRRRLPNFSFRVLSDEPGTADNDDGSVAIPTSP